MPASSSSPRSRVALTQQLCPSAVWLFMFVDPYSRAVGCATLPLLPASALSLDPQERTLGHQASDAWPALGAPHLTAWRYVALHGATLIAGVRRASTWPRGLEGPQGDRRGYGMHQWRTVSPATRDITRLSTIWRAAQPHSLGKPSETKEALVVPAPVREPLREVLVRTHFWAISKGRYTPYILRFLDMLGIQLPGPEEGLQGTVTLEGKAHRFAYMKDAAIPRFVNAKEGRFGFSGSHQVLATHARLGQEAVLEHLGLIRLPLARFALATSARDPAEVKRALAEAAPVRVSTEYLAAAAQVALERGWSSMVLQLSSKGYAELDAARYPGLCGALAIVSSGKTLEDNRLSIVPGMDDLAPIWINAVWNAPGAASTTTQSTGWPFGTPPEPEALEWLPRIEGSRPAKRAPEPSADASACEHPAVAAPATSAPAVFTAETLAQEICGRMRLADVWALSKNRYEAVILEFLNRLGFDVPRSAEAMCGDCQGHEFLYSRDAGIPLFIATRQRAIGFTGSHQLVEARTAFHVDLEHRMAVRLPETRFALAVPESKVERVQWKLARGAQLLLQAEHLGTAKRIALQQGWNVALRRSDEDMAEIDAAHRAQADGALTIVSEVDRATPNGLKILHDRLEPVCIHAIWSP